MKKLHYSTKFNEQQISKESNFTENGIKNRFNKTIKLWNFDIKQNGEKQCFIDKNCTENQYSNKKKTLQLSEN